VPASPEQGEPAAVGPPAATQLAAAPLPYPGPSGPPVNAGQWGPPAPGSSGAPTHSGPWGQPGTAGPWGPPPAQAPWGPSPNEAQWGPPPGAGREPSAGPPGAYPAGPPGAYPPAWPAGYAPYPPGPGRQPGPPARTHRWGLGAYFLVEAVFLLASVAVAGILGDRLSSSAGALVIALVVPTVLAAGTALLVTWWRGNGPAIDLGLQFSWRDVGIGLAFGVGGLVITIPASLLYVAIVGNDTTSAVGEEFGGVRSGPLLAVVVFVIVVFVAPLCEEIVYRGLLWGAVEKLGAKRWWALVITTVVFALAHFEFTRTPLLLVVAIPIALSRLYTGRLTAGVVAHGVNNLLPAVSLVLMLLGVLPGTS
jgi:membrane protease YdiL (CAAX protease family)